jgi:phosphatidylinositol kinase/protein kinase (PI-3  family)
MCRISAFVNQLEAPPLEVLILFGEISSLLQYLLKRNLDFGERTLDQLYEVATALDLELLLHQLLRASLSLGKNIVHDIRD